MAIAIERDAERRDGNGPRPAARRPGAREGQHRHRRRMLTTAGSLGAGRAPADRRRAGRHPAARGRGGRPRQDQPERVGQPALARTRRAAGARAVASPATRGTPARSAGGSSSGSGAAVAAGLAPLARGHRDRRLDRVPGLAQRRRRREADGRPAPCRRHRAHLAQPGHRRPDGPHRPRGRGPARRPRRQRRRYADAAPTPTSAGDALGGLRVGVARAHLRRPRRRTDAVAEHALSRVAGTAPRSSTRPTSPTLPTYDAGDDELTVLLHELKHDLDAYLATRPERRPTHPRRRRRVQPRRMRAPSWPGSARSSSSRPWPLGGLDDRGLPDRQRHAGCAQPATTASTRSIGEHGSTRSWRPPSARPGSATSSTATT